MDYIGQTLLIILLMYPAIGSLADGQPADATPVVNQEPANARLTPLEKVESNIEHSIDKVQPLLERYGYPAIFIAVMVEGSGLLAPGQTLLMAGVLAAADGKLRIAAVLTGVILATVLGNSLGYLIGRWGGRTLLTRLGANARHVQKMESFYDHYGGGVVLFGRFVDGLRQLNGIVAGMLAMPWWTFTLFNVAGAILWTCLWGLGTYYLDKDIHAIVYIIEQFKPFAIGLSLVVFSGLLIYLFWYRRTR
jgi:membrane protein DedA with SNARE-associated domain